MLRVQGLGDLGFRGLGNRLACLLEEVPGAIRDFIWTSIPDNYSGLLKITTHLDHIGHCNKASGTNWSNRWTYREIIINTRRDKVREFTPSGI